jgi:hypothetical protein
VTFLVGCDQPLDLQIGEVMAHGNGIYAHGPRKIIDGRARVAEQGLKDSISGTFHFVTTSRPREAKPEGSISAGGSNVNIIDNYHKY